MRSYSWSELHDLIRLCDSIGFELVHTVDYDSFFQNGFDLKTHSIQWPFNIHQTAEITDEIQQQFATMLAVVFVLRKREKTI